MFREEQTLGSLTCLENNKFEEYNMFSDEQTLRSITCLENNKLCGV